MIFHVFTGFSSERKFSGGDENDDERIFQRAIKFSLNHQKIFAIKTW